METTLSCETTVPAQTSICPVCHGTGHVDAGFYMSTGISWISAGGAEQCKSCHGKGYVVI